MVGFFRRRNIRGFQLGPVQMQVLSEANRLLAAGHPGEAAQLFANLAQQMEGSNHPRRAANLHAQAAHAYADNQDATDALTHARRALTLFLQYQMVERTPRFYANIERKLRARNMSTAADSLQAEFGKQVGSLPQPQVQPQAPGQQRLPPTCPQCGAPVRGDEVDWINQYSAECIYCGAVIQTEK
ncbi:MAG: hypothetical protein ABSE06_02795 [Anaerolineaceae bacterium]|jgi:hypothetical protein